MPTNENEKPLGAVDAERCKCGKSHFNGVAWYFLAKKYLLLTAIGGSEDHTSLDRRTAFCPSCGARLGVSADGRPWVLAADWWERVARELAGMIAYDYNGNDAPENFIETAAQAKGVE
jgi:hypothetical protein